MSSQPGQDPGDLADHARWCREDEPHRVCWRVTSWPDMPARVSACFSRGRGHAYVYVKRDGIPGVGLEPHNAQALSTVLAFLAPSQHTAGLGIALQEAAALIFRAEGKPDVGTVEGAINPWKSQH